MSKEQALAHLKTMLADTKAESATLPEGYCIVNQMEHSRMADDIAALTVAIEILENCGE